MSQHQSRCQFWRVHLERCRGLGITVKAYAEQEGLTVSVFYLVLLYGNQRETSAYDRSGDAQKPPPPGGREHCHGTQSFIPFTHYSLGPLVQVLAAA